MAQQQTIRVHPRIIIAARVLLVLFALVLAYTVLMPSQGNQVLGAVAQFSRWVASVGVPYRLVFTVVEFTANIVMFMPLGFLLPLVIGRVSQSTVRATVWVGFVLSASIEISQLVIPGRVSTVMDVLANTAGAAVGAGLVWVCAHWVHQFRSGSHTQ